MADDNKKKMSGPPEPEDKNPKDEIPLWLQGLQEHEDEDTNPIEVGEKSENSFSASATQDFNQEDAPDVDPPQDAVQNLSQVDDSPPDWLSELSGVTPEKPSVLDKNDELSETGAAEQLRDSFMTEDEPEEIELQQLSTEEIPDEVDGSYEDLPGENPSEDKDEQDDVNRETSPQSEFPRRDTEDEDLPPWLQEMIAEPQEPTLGQHTDHDEMSMEEKTVTADEDTEPVELSGATPPPEGQIIADELGMEEEERIAEEDVAQPETEIESEPEVFQNFEEEEVDKASNPTLAEGPAEWIPEQINTEAELEEETPAPAEMPATTIEGDTRPIDISEVSKQEHQNNEAEEAAENSTEEEQEEAREVEVEENVEEGNAIVEESNQETSMIDELPETDAMDLPVGSEPAALPADLAEARDALGLGETEQAVNLIRQSENKSSHLQEIQTWLMSAVNTMEDPGVDLWDLLGDITLENDQPDLAFDAYAKAIRSLLRSQEVKDEIS